MFENIMNLKFKRSATQAIGFYLVFFIFLLLISFLIGIVAGLINPDVDAVKVGNITAIVYSVILYYAVYFNKKMSSIIYLFVGILTGIAAYFGGGLLSLLIVAFLTTQGNTEKQITEELETIEE